MLLVRHEQGHHVKGVARGISSRMLPSIVEVTPVDERVMPLRMKHNLGFMSVVTVYAPSKVCETGEKEIFYAKLDSVPVPVVMHSLSWVTLMLSPALKWLAMRYVLDPMALEPGMTTAFSF